MVLSSYFLIFTTIKQGFLFLRNMRKLLLLFSLITSIICGVFAQIPTVIITPNTASLGETLDVFISGNSPSDFETFSPSSAGFLYLRNDDWSSFEVPNNSANAWQWNHAIGSYGFYSTITIPNTSDEGGSMLGNYDLFMSTENNSWWWEYETTKIGSNVFVVTEPTYPYLGEINRGEGYPGEALSVSISGGNIDIGSFSGTTNNLRFSQYSNTNIFYADIDNWYSCEEESNSISSCQYFRSYNIDIPWDQFPGVYELAIWDIGTNQWITSSDSFEVRTGEIMDISPNEGNIGQTLSVYISGRGIDFSGDSQWSGTLSNFRFSQYSSTNIFLGIPTYSYPGDEMMGEYARTLHGEVIIPSGQNPGWYNLEVYDQATQQWITNSEAFEVIEIAVTSNPQVNSISPNSGEQGETLSVSISGNNMDYGWSSQWSNALSYFRFSQWSSSNMFYGTSTGESGNELYGDVTISSTQNTGWYDLEVYDKISENWIMLNNAFEVTSSNNYNVSTTPTNRNVVLEQFGGVACIHCPDGHKIVEEIRDSLGEDRVLPIEIHSNFNSTVYGENYETPFGSNIDQNASINGYPAGTVNRHYFANWSQGGTSIDRNDYWPAAESILNISSPVNIWSEASINNDTREMIIDIELYYTGSSIESTNRLNIALIQNNIAGPQSGASNNPDQILPSGDYNHMFMLRHLINGLGGIDIYSISQGVYFDTSFTYTIPNDYNGVPVDLSNVELVVFVSEDGPDSQEIITGIGVDPYMQSCSDLFFSEYIEGDDQSKALEIYNPTQDSISLHDYAIERYANGYTYNTSGGNTNLPPILLAPGDVFVITSGETDTASSYGICDPVLFNMADFAEPSGSYPTPLHFNGNDVIVLIKLGEVIDVIGRLGENPPSGAWTDDTISGFTLGVPWTKDHTLIRKSNVLFGDANGLDLFNPSLEWDSLPLGTYSNLGYHNCNCNNSITYGCTDSPAWNYDPTATVDDGSCQYGTSCMSDSQYTVPGIYPDNVTGLADAYVGESYNEVMTVIINTDTLANLPGLPLIAVTFDNIDLTNVIGLPNGFSYACDPPTCSFPAGSISCVSIYSTQDPTSIDVGSYPLLFETTLNVSNFPFIGAITQDDIIVDYTINILEPPVQGCVDSSALTLSAL